jgi:hypothetical protein
MAGEKGTNGAYEVNGNGSHSSSAGKGSAMAFGVGPAFKEQPEKTPKANREGITKAFAQLGQWAHASDRPYPTQNGDGTFTLTKRPGFKKDLKALSKKGT